MFWLLLLLWTILTLALRIDFHINFSAHTRLRSHDQSKNRSIEKNIWKAKKAIDKFLGNKVSCAILRSIISKTQQLILIAFLQLQIILSMTHIFPYFNSLSDQIGVHIYFHSTWSCCVPTIAKRDSSYWFLSQMYFISLYWYVAVF